jgi:methanogenic corrinoid protein MtbC1
MNSILEKLSYCVERGKINTNANFPPDMIGEKGAEEYTTEALSDHIPANEILNNALIPGMERIGVKFRENKVFVPEVLMAAKAMKASMTFLNDFFNEGKAQKKGTLVIGTVEGDLHDIGKNLVAMIVEGNGWQIIDLGTNVKTENFIKTIEENPGAYVALSALLTTTMLNMEKTVKEIKKAFPQTNILIGGAPVTESFGNSIGADFYSADPYGAVKYLNHFTK